MNVCQEQEIRSYDRQIEPKICRDLLKSSAVVMLLPFVRLSKVDENVLPGLLVCFCRVGMYDAVFLGSENAMWGNSEVPAHCMWLYQATVLEIGDDLLKQLLFGLDGFPHVV